MHPSLTVIVILALALGSLLLAFSLGRAKGPKPESEGVGVARTFPSPFGGGVGLAAEQNQRANNTTESSNSGGNRRYESMLAIGFNASMQAMTDKALQFMLAVHPSRIGVDGLLPHERMLMLHALNTSQTGNTNTLAWMDLLDPISPHADFLDCAGGACRGCVAEKDPHRNAFVPFVA